MVTDSDGKIADVIAVQNVASKGKNGGREIPVHPGLKASLVALQAHRGDLAMPERPVVHSERGPGMSANSVTVWFHRLYEGLGMDGCSSHSGRRTFVTKAAHKIVEAGGSLRDVQQLAGHTSLATTQRYIEGSNDAKRKVVQMI
jgi:integrase